LFGTARKIGLDRLLGPDGNRCRDLVLALIVSRLLEPGSKLAAARALSPDTASSSLGQQLGLGMVDEDEVYTALDWLAVRQPAIETALAKCHLAGGTLVLYDVSSSYMEGRCCPLAQFGYNRDRKRGKLQIVYGLLCAPDGCPVAIEVFEGNTADPMTLTSQVRKLRERFGLDHVVLVGDRGMITQRLAPMLYDDTDKDAAEAQRASVVAKAERSLAARSQRVRRGSLHREPVGDRGTRRRENRTPGAARRLSAANWRLSPPTANPRDLLQTRRRHKPRGSRTPTVPP
jgi:hypothetical protein